MTANLGTALTAAALSLVLASSLVDLRHAHDRLETLATNQQTQAAAGQKVEAQLNALAKGTQQLAQSGNANAARIVAVLQANGVRINAN